MVNGFVATMASQVIRSILNGAMARVSPSQLTSAIRDNLSLWGESANHIQQYADKLPPAVKVQAGEYVQMVNTQYGGFTPLVLEWLKEDQIVYYSLIINTNGGEEWLSTQIYDILRGLGIDG